MLNVVMMTEEAAAGMTDAYQIINATSCSVVS